MTDFTKKELFQLDPRRPKRARDSTGREVRPIADILAHTDIEEILVKRVLMLESRVARLEDKLETLYIRSLNQDWDKE